jgi:hypothetical protein
MFNSTKKNDNIFPSAKRDSDSLEKRENTETTIGSQCVIKGNISNPSSLKFHGQLEGTINCGDYLVICKEAVIDGDIEADTAVLYGNLTGSIRADKVELKSCAQINGDIESYVFDMENGAFFNGNIKMLRPDEKINRTEKLTTRADLEKEKKTKVKEMDHKKEGATSNANSNTSSSHFGSDNSKEPGFIKSVLFDKKK